MHVFSALTPFCPAIPKGIAHDRGLSIKKDRASRFSRNPSTGSTPEIRANAFKKTYQRSLVRRIKDQRSFFPHNYVRSRLEGWELPRFPRLNADEALSTLAFLGDKVPPRVSAAVLGTFFHRWITDDKMPPKNCDGVIMRYGSKCMFGCSHGDDSLRHYTTCYHVGTFGRSFLGLAYPQDMKDRRARFLLLDPSVKPDQGDEAVRGAILIYAV